MIHFLLVLLLAQSLQAKDTVIIGSKAFTENYVLAEIAAQTLEQVGEVEVERKFGMGGAGMVFQAITEGHIQIYPDYSGTISEAILKNPKLVTTESINQALVSKNLRISKSLGFNNTYAFAVRADSKFKTISDLKSQPDIGIAAAYEFLNRSDGMQALQKHYEVHFSNVKGMEHSLSYPALMGKSVDAMVAYSTDAKIQKHKLKILEDDREFFPTYLAVFLMQRDFPEKYPQSWKALEKLEGSLTAEKMRSLNALVDEEGETFAQAAQFFLRPKEKQIQTSHVEMSKLFQYTKEHLFLVVVSLFASILVGIPMGVIAYKKEKWAQVILSVSGLIQTIPSLALLCFFIPLMGIGTIPALCALFLYGLLPIVRNTYEGLNGISPQLQISAATLNLSSAELLKRVELPLASKSIMAGIKTSAVINVGTATLAAFIGAGGLGTPIMTGLALNNTQLILFGAIPSALLALTVHFFFELLDRIVIPKGLR